MNDDHQLSLDFLICHSLSPRYSIVLAVKAPEGVFRE
jgi:hypothetical protein